MPGAHACSQVRGNAWVKGREEREGEMANVCSDLKAQRIEALKKLCHKPYPLCYLYQS
jgi:hypothetical protein